MKTFFDALKEFMINTFKDNRDVQPWSYYETIVQQRDLIQEIVSDYEKHDINFQFNANDIEEDSYYDRGSISIYLYKKSEDRDEDEEHIVARCVVSVLRVLVPAAYWHGLSSSNR